jgi:hypothetical protein
MVLVYLLLDVKSDGLNQVTEVVEEVSKNSTFTGLTTLISISRMRLTKVR